MINFLECNDLFSHSSFYGLKKELASSHVDQEILNQIVLPAKTVSFHPQRHQEFLLGRFCASQAFLKLTGKPLLNLPIGENRQPVWPLEIVGSISHNQHWVGAAVASSKQLMGIGIDFEVMGRTRTELSGYITNEHDITQINSFNAEELLTLIFSAKESLYKALYPTVKKFFGFEAAAVTSLDPVKKIFIIELLIPLTVHLAPGRRYQFTGRYERDQQSCLTVIEVLHS